MKLFGRRRVQLPPKEKFPRHIAIIMDGNGRWANRRGMPRRFGHSAGAERFREISEYCPFGKIRKRVVFFLAQAFTDNVKIQEEEIDSYIWVDLQQARKMCSYDNDSRIIEKAETAIHLLRN